MQTRNLFSRHPLENRLPDHPEGAQDPPPAFAAVRTLATAGARHWGRPPSQKDARWRNTRKKIAIAIVEGRANG